MKKKNHRGNIDVRFLKEIKKLGKFRSCNFFNLLILFLLFTPLYAFIIPAEATTDDFFLSLK